MSKSKEEIAAYQKAYRQANKDKLRAQALSYAIANREKIRERERAWRAKNSKRLVANVKAWREKNKEHFLASSREYLRRIYSPEKNRERLLRKNYGISVGEYEALLLRQGSRCAICHSDKPGRGSFHVDHDHKTGVIRGLLCQLCNTALGLFGDSAERLMKAAAYVTDDEPIRIGA